MKSWHWILPVLFVAASLPAEAQRKGRRGPDNAPKVGEAIPKVSAKTPDGKKTVALHEPRRLTVLVFGSYT